MTVRHSGAVIMTPELEQIYQDLSHLSPIEHWQVMEYLIGQLKRSAIPQETSATVIPQPHLSAQEVFAATQGSWGSRSMDEIDAALAQQRRFDWGE
jgi:hypothetical protein